MSGWAFRSISNKWSAVQGINRPRKTYLEGPRELGHKLVETFVGKVVSTKMQKTCAVEVSQFHLHPRIRKYVKHSSRFMTHDPLEEANYGDVVEIRTCRPISKTKHHILHRIIRHRPTIHYDQPAPKPLTYRNLLKHQQQLPFDTPAHAVDTSVTPTDPLSYESIETPLPFIRFRGREADEAAARELNDLEKRSWYKAEQEEKERLKREVPIPTPKF